MADQNNPFIENEEAKLRAWEARIDELRAEAQKQEASAREKIYQKIDELTQEKDEFKKRIQALREAGEDKWDEIRGEIEKRSGKVKEAIADAAALIESKTRPE